MTTTTFRSDAERATAQGLLLAQISDHATDDGLATAEAILTAIRELLDRHGIHPGQVDGDGQPVPPPHDGHCQTCGWNATPRSQP